MKATFFPIGPNMDMLINGMLAFNVEADGSQTLGNPFGKTILYLQQ